MAPPTYRRNGYKLPATPDGSLKGKVALITGASSGIGTVTALELASHGVHVILACRSATKTQPVLDEIAKKAPSDAPKAECWEVELASIDSVNQLADRFIASGLPLHLLINNAGFAGAAEITSAVRTRMET